MRQRGAWRQAGTEVSGAGGERSSGPADPELAGILVSRSKELMSDLTGGSKQGSEGRRDDLRQRQDTK